MANFWRWRSSPCKLRSKRRSWGKRTNGSGVLESERSDETNKTNFGEVLCGELPSGVWERLAWTVGQADGADRQVFQHACGDFFESVESGLSIDATCDRQKAVASARVQRHRD